MPKSPEMPSTEGKEPQPLEEMDNTAIEEEMKEREVSLPPRWAFYDEEARRNTLSKVRSGEIPAKYEWPSAKGGGRSFWTKEK